MRTLEAKEIGLISGGATSGEVFSISVINGSLIGLGGGLAVGWFKEGVKGLLENGAVGFSLGLMASALISFPLGALYDTDFTENTVVVISQSPY